MDTLLFTPMLGGIIGGAVGLLFFLFWMALCLVGLIFWIWMLVHAIQNKGLSDMEKLLWVLVILFTNLLGAILYFFIGKPKGT